MSICLVDIHGDIEGDYDIVDRSGKYVPLSMLEDIKAEIRALPKTYPFVNHLDTYIKEDDVLEIIDNHISGKDSK